MSTIQCKGIFSRKSDEWSTPQEFFDALNKEFHFTLDPCSTDDNCKCEKHYTKENSGLEKDWQHETVFVNPPYSEVEQWCSKCWYEYACGDCTIVMLVPARTDTKWFHRYVIPWCDEIRFIRGRLKFGNSNQNAPFASMLCIWKRDGEETRFRRSDATVTSMERR